MPKTRRGKRQASRVATEPTDQPIVPVAAAVPEPKAGREVFSANPLVGEFKKQGLTSLVTVVVTIVVAAFLPDSIKNQLRYGLALLLELVIGSYWAIGTGAGVALGFALARRRFRVSLLAGTVCVLTVSAVVGVSQYVWKTDTSSSPTIAVFGFLKSGEDGSLQAVPALEGLSRVLADELESQGRETPCLADGGYSAKRVSIHNFHLSGLSVSSLDDYIRRTHPNLGLAMWALVGSSGNIEEFHTLGVKGATPVNAAMLDKAAQQFTRAFNRGSSTRVPAVRFAARTFVAVLGNAVSAPLLSQGSEWATTCATFSLSRLRSARAALETYPEFEADISSHTAYWEPAYLVARGNGHRDAKRYDEAAKEYLSAAMINPLFPFTSIADHEEAGLTRGGLGKPIEISKEIIDLFGSERPQVQRWLEQLRSSVPQPYGPGLDRPVLDLLQWSLLKSKDGEDLVDRYFGQLSTKFPAEPLIWIYWGDFYTNILGVEWFINSESISKHPDLLKPALFERLEPAIVKYESAVRVAPTFRPALRRQLHAYLLAVQLQPAQRSGWLAKARRSLHDGKE